MAAVKGSDIPLEQDLFNQSWKFLKTFYNVSNDDELDKAIIEAKRIQSKYNGTKVEVFSCELIASCLNRIGEVYAADFPKQKGMI